MSNDERRSGTEGTLAVALLDGIDALLTEVRIQRQISTIMLTRLSAIGSSQLELLKTLNRLDSAEVERDSRMAKKFADYAAEFDTHITSLTAKVAGQTDVISGAVTLLQGTTATVSGLKAQIQELIDNGSGDPAILQPVLDNITVIETGIADNTQKLASAVSENTSGTPATPVTPAPATTAPATEAKRPGF